MNYHSWEGWQTISHQITKFQENSDSNSHLQVLRVRPPIGAVHLSCLRVRIIVITWYWYRPNGIKLAGGMFTRILWKTLPRSIPTIMGFTSRRLEKWILITNQPNHQNNGRRWLTTKTCQPNRSRTTKPGERWSTHHSYSAKTRKALLWISRRNSCIKYSTRSVSTMKVLNYETDTLITLLHEHPWWSNTQGLVCPVAISL